MRDVNFEEMTIMKAQKDNKAYLAIFPEDVTGETVDECLHAHGYQNGWPRAELTEVDFVDGRGWVKARDKRTLHSAAHD